MSRDRESARRTPVIGASEVTPVDTGWPKDAPAADSPPAGLVHGPHLAHGYTRRQLMRRDPLVSAAQTQVPETVVDVPVESGRVRLPEPTEMGAIIGFQRSYDGGKTVYSYAAIKTPKGWYSTAFHLPPMAWPDLLARIDAWCDDGDEPSAIWLAVDWVEVE